MPFIYTKKEQLSEAELFGKANEARRGATVPPEKRVSLAQGYAASKQELAAQAEQELAEPKSFASLVERSKQEYPFIVPGDMLPPGSKFRPAKESVINPPEPTEP